MKQHKPFDPYDSVPESLVNIFDIDGVIYMGEGLKGVYPGPSDIIITGRSLETREMTQNMLLEKGITNPLYMNNKPKNWNNREQSGYHKAMTMFQLEQLGYRFGIHFEDDPIQMDAINRMMPHIKVVLLDHNLTEK